LSERTRDVAIIGGGPAGLTAGIYLSRGKIDAILLEQKLPGGTAAMSPLIENYPGFPQGISGIELTERMKRQADRFELQMKTFAHVTRVALDTGTPVITLEDGEIRANSVIIATGQSPRKIGIPGEEEYAGRGVSYCATCDGPLFKDKVVMVIGGGDAAVGEALHLSKFASKVILVHRRDELRASAYLEERASREPNLEFMWNSEITEIKGDQIVRTATISDNVTGARAEVPVAGIFFYAGNTPNTEFLAGVVELDEAGYVVTGENLETSVPGVFAAGDARAGSWKQIIVSAAEGALASQGAQRYLETIGAKKAYEGGH